MISCIDHIVITTRDIKVCSDFYTRILGMELIHFGDNRIAFKFGQQKINVHEYGKEIEPKAHLPVPGSLDICLISSYSIDEIKKVLEKNDIVIVDGPVSRTGACGAITSLYLRDPDLNLIEISNYENH
ncbi:VOC family protein [Xylella fastidiosa]|uniref:Lactoylglutathione lyase n=1 Tax=Xylella fastidiosa subsp. sandyi Ann-1 TaxID=155920 RepID=A0A060H442_XYLFS|nr:VOC family protein [Xylella fastidiosa]AIC11534.1 lactoylglutathione lyase [Xylella fastidiosa subsp. sandyi Ann-1]UIX80686.1 VOC family protein [Xylella fastidiosa subsp. sandyi]